MNDNERVYDFTVIVPCHNAAGFIMPLIHTLAMQDVSGMKMQYIFVLDKCTDNTKSVLNDYVDMINADRTDIITCSHGRAGLARNEGLDMAFGKIIIFLDSDDNLIRPDFFRILHSSFVQYKNADILLFNFIMNDSVVGIDHNRSTVFPACWSRAYKREIIGSTRFNDDIVGEDLVFATELFNKAPKCYDIGKVMVWYNFPRNGSLSSIMACDSGAQNG